MFLDLICSVVPYQDHVTDGDESDDAAIDSNGMEVV